MGSEGGEKVEMGMSLKMKLDGTWYYECGRSSRWRLGMGGGGVEGRMKEEVLSGTESEIGGWGGTRTKRGSWGGEWAVELADRVAVVKVLGRAMRLKTVFGERNRLGTSM